MWHSMTHLPHALHTSLLQANRCRVRSRSVGAYNCAAFAEWVQSWDTQVRVTMPQSWTTFATLHRDHTPVATATVAHRNRSTTAGARRRKREKTTPRRPHGFLWVALQVQRMYACPEARPTARRPCFCYAAQVFAATRCAPWTMAIRRGHNDSSAIAAHLAPKPGWFCICVRSSPCTSLSLRSGAAP